MLMDILVHLDMKVMAEIALSMRKGQANSGEGLPQGTSHAMVVLEGSQSPGT